MVQFNKNSKIYKEMEAIIEKTHKSMKISNQILCLSFIHFLLGIIITWISIYLTIKSFIFFRFISSLFEFMIFIPKSFMKIIEILTYLILFYFTLMGIINIISGIGLSIKKSWGRKISIYFWSFGILTFILFPLTLTYLIMLNKKDIKKEFR